MKYAIAVLFGGCSSEYGVSLKSACSVCRAISTEKYECILVGITKEGELKCVHLDGVLPIKVPKGWFYQISGDNRGGLIKTIWRRV